MNAQIQERVEQFVQEILDLVERAGSERRSEVLSAVTTLLAAEADRPPRKGPSTARAPTSSTKGRVARRPTPSPGSDHGGPRSRRRAPSGTTAPPGVGSRSSSNAPRGRAGGARSSSGEADPMGLVSVAAAPSPAAPGAEATATGPVAEREGQVLAAVRALGRPTAREVAGHTGLPNGSVAVALRALGARGLVARAESGRGIEYTLPPAASWA
jgi:hypothetical protein